MFLDPSKINDIKSAAGPNESQTNKIQKSEVPLVESLMNKIQKPEALPFEPLKNKIQRSEVPVEHLIDKIQKPEALEKVNKLQVEQNLLIKSQKIDFDNTQTNPVEALKNGWQSFIHEFKDKAFLRRKFKTENVNQYVVKYHFSTQTSTAKQIVFDPNKQYDYTVANSVSLVPKHGKMFLYGCYENTLINGIQPSMNAGILLDLEKCKLNEEHIYKRDAAAGHYGSRPWEIQAFNQAAAEFQIEINDENKSINELRNNPCTLEELRKETSEDKVYDYNELLVKSKEDAIVGLFAHIGTQTEDQKVIATNYANKLYSLIQQQCFYQEAGVEAPVFLFTPSDGLQLYTKEQIQADFQTLKENESLRHEVLSILGCPNNDAFDRIEKMLQKI